MKPLHFTSSLFDDRTLTILEDLFVASNLTEVVIRAHLLVERALALRVAQKFARPVVVTGADTHWSFAQLMLLYIGLFDPPSETEQTLRGLNKLRNRIAHHLELTPDVVAECIPWKGEQYPDPPDAVTHVRTAIMVLMGDLGGIDSMMRGEFVDEQVGMLRAVLPPSVPLPSGPELTRLVSQISSLATLTLLANELTEAQVRLIRELANGPLPRTEVLTRFSEADLRDLDVLMLIKDDGTEFSLCDTDLSRYVVGGVIFK